MKLLNRCNGKMKNKKKNKIVEMSTQSMANIEVKGTIQVSFSVVKLVDNDKLDIILQHIDNKVIAGQIALFYFCGTQNYTDFYLPNVTSEKKLEEDIQNILDAFKIGGGYIMFFFDEHVDDKCTSKQYDSLNGLIVRK